MKAKSGFLILLGVSLFCVLCSCTNKPVVYTYEDLSKEHQAIIDGVMDAFDDWKSVEDNTATRNCFLLGFDDVDGQLYFTAFYSHSKAEYSNLGVSQVMSSCIYEVDASNGKMTRRHFASFEQDKAQRAEANILSNFSVDASVQEQKNILSNNLYKVLHKTNTK